MRGTGKDWVESGLGLFKLLRNAYEEAGENPRKRQLYESVRE